MNIVVLWSIMILMAWWQIPRLTKRNQKKDIIVFLGIWLSAGIYGSLVISEITLISPFDLIIIMIENYLPLY